MWTEVMNIASAYPNSALSVGALVILAFVMVICLALWLIMVFRAGKSGSRDVQLANGHLTVAAPDETAEDEHSGTGDAPAGRRRGAAA
jgi:hypothetical protein